MKTVKRTYLQMLLILLTITLTFPSSASAQVTSLDKVRFLLNNYYVEPVKADVLNSPTIDAILTQLNDPYTEYMTSDDFKDFNNYLEERYIGIGISADIVAKGVRITGLFSGSPADKAGIQKGDIITAIDSHPLEGLSAEQIDPLLKGPEGSTIQLTCQRADTFYTVQVQRINITVPSATGEIKPFNTAYLEIGSFGSETSDLFATSLASLHQQNPKSYIIDLRDNGGGYGDAALDIAGYFIGDNVALQTNYRGLPPYIEKATKHNFIVDKPTIFLINHYTASASEILAGAVKDYNKAVFIGTQSYGKGCMQQIFPMANGDYFKMTTAYFHTPLANVINHKGITPDLVIEKADPLDAALLLLSGSSSNNNSDLVDLTLASKSLIIDTKEAEKPDYWQAYGEILDKASVKMMKGNGVGGWVSIRPQELKDRRSLYYPDYKLGDQTTDITVDSNFVIHFPQNINWQTINQQNIELIASDSGVRIPLVFQQLGAEALQAVPQENPHPGTTYWLLLHPDIQYTNGSPLESGIIFAGTPK